MKILNIDNKEVKNNDRYEIGSQTKMFTALMILKAYEDNLISLEDKIEKYLDISLIEFYTEYTQKTFTAEGKTIKELLAHKVILPDFVNLSKKHYDDEKIFNLFKTLDFTNVDHNTFVEIIKKYNKEDEDEMKKNHYSNTGYYLLTLLIEKLYKCNYLEAVKNNILTPLDMNNTDLNNSNFQGSFKGESFVFNPMIYTGAGSLVSNHEDMNKFMLGIERIINVDTFNLWKELAETNKLGAGILNLKSVLKDQIEIENNWWGHLGQSLQFQSGTFMNDNKDIIIGAIGDSNHKIIIDFINEIKK